MAKAKKSKNIQQTKKRLDNKIADRKMRKTSTIENC